MTSFNFNQGLFKLNITDHYAVLGISLRATEKEIRKRYLKIAQKLHPDTCKAKTTEEKELANQVLAKIVNPAYEVLSKEKTRAEQLLIYNAIGERIAREGGKVSISFKSSKELLQLGANFQYGYDKILITLASRQYDSLENLNKKIDQLSELNLIYSVMLASQNLKKQQEREHLKDNINGPNTVLQKISPAANYLNRAKQYLASNNYIQAVAELREALKLDPDSSTIYGLLGIAYLRQGQLSMARVYVKKASEIDPKNPVAIDSKKELNQYIYNSQQTTYQKTPPNQKTPPKTKPSDKGGGSGGFFGGLFGGKKK